MVTAATYLKESHFLSPEKIQFLHDSLLRLSKEHGWGLQAWAVLSNHYHFIAQSPNHPESLTGLISHLHANTAKFVNEIDGTPNRRIWWQYWDSHITYAHSYLARLNYINQNAVKHGIVNLATDYPWCSAQWFEKTNPVSFCKTIQSFKIDKVKVLDEF
jgi:putative transposase